MTSIYGHLLSIDRVFDVVGDLLSEKFYKQPNEPDWSRREDEEDIPYIRRLFTFLEWPYIIGLSVIDENVVVGYEFFEEGKIYNFEELYHNFFWELDCVRPEEFPIKV